jgi:hypothetical protein
MPIASIRRIAVAASVAALAAVPTTTSAAYAGDHPHPSHPYPPHGRLYVTQQTYACGSLSYVGTGFVPREPVTVKLDSVVLDTDQANRAGTASGNVRVPCDTQPGSHVFSLTGQSSGQYLSANVKVRRHHNYRAAEAASVKIGAAPMADHITKAEKAPGRSGPVNTVSAAGAAAALAVLGGGTYLVLRRRRADNWRG